MDLLQIFPIEFNVRSKTQMLQNLLSITRISAASTEKRKKKFRYRLKKNSTILTFPSAPMATHIQSLSLLCTVGLQWWCQDMGCDIIAGDSLPWERWRSMSVFFVLFVFYFYYLFQRPSENPQANQHNLVWIYCCRFTCRYTLRAYEHHKGDPIISWHGLSFIYRCSM